MFPESLLSKFQYFQFSNSLFSNFQILEFSNPPVSSKGAAEVEMERKIFHIDVQLVLLHRPLECGNKRGGKYLLLKNGGSWSWRYLSVCLTSLNIYLETNGSFYVNKKEPEEHGWEANSFFWGKLGKYSPVCLFVCLFVDNLNFYLCATHIAPRHKCLLRRTTCRKSSERSGWWAHEVIMSLIKWQLKMSAWFEIESHQWTGINRKQIMSLVKAMQMKNTENAWKKTR